MKFLVLCAAAMTLSGQTMTEYGLGAGRAATTAAPAAGVGKAVAGALTNLDKTIKSAGKTSSETSEIRGTGIVLPKETKPAAPAKMYEDISKVEVGLAYDELLDRFGPPSMQITGEDGIRKLSYGATKVQIKDNKVLAISAPPKSNTR